MKNLRLPRPAALALIAAIAASLGGAPAIAQSAPKPKVACGSASNTKYKPSYCRFLMARDEAGIDIGKIRWTTWTSTTAVGVGTFRGNQGYRAKARITLRAPERCGEGAAPWFSKMTLRIGGGKASTSRLMGPCS